MHAYNFYELFNEQSGIYYLRKHFDLNSELIHSYKASLSKDSFQDPGEPKVKILLSLETSSRSCRKWPGETEKT
jgi:hypothetical protein